MKKRAFKTLVNATESLCVDAALQIGNIEI
jgi:hypothetical protein